MNEIRINITLVGRVQV